MTETVLPFQVFEAPETWRTVDFISDLHLQEKETATFEVWQAYMQNTTADAVFILWRPVRGLGRRRCRRTAHFFFRDAPLF